MNATRPQTLPLVLVDDDIEVLASWELILHANGIENLVLCSDPRTVVPLIHKREIGVVVLDLNMPKLDGETLLQMLREYAPEVPVIICTGANTVEVAVRCMRLGASDYLVKPVSDTDMLFAIQRAMELRQLESENERLSKRVLSDTLEHPEAFSSIITSSLKMRALFKYAEAIADSSKPVSIVGESGVGKELFASAIHVLSQRKGPYVALNVAGLDDNVFADTLFGHLRGAFTGADSPRRGCVELASHGTLFLDEIGDLAPTSQVKLLRLLQEREYLPLGGDVPKLSTARVVVATNQNLESMVASGLFRRDLFYRLNTHTVRLPPLRERAEDIPLLARHFVEEASRTLGKPIPMIAPAAMSQLCAYGFPGNVRELEAIVFDAVARHPGGPMTASSFGQVIEKAGNESAASQRFANHVSFGEFAHLPTLREGAHMLIDEAMRRANGNQSVASKLLGISQPSLSRRLKSMQE